ncbi:MAG: NERD domain-containing protein [Bacilli bacterium]|nr:NERD domain-containing protein [Bacilli bacterium]
MWLLKKSWFWLILVLDILLYFSYKKIIGMAGEHWVKKELKKLSDEYYIINDLLFKTKDGKTHQIDHLVVSRYGIFVIETKQYNGYIRGNDYDKKWEIKTGNKNFFVNNPVHQNYGHIESLKEILYLKDNCFISIVCISSNAKIKINSNVVTRLADLLNKIVSYKKEVLPNDKEIYNLLNTINIKDKKERRNHIKTVKERKKEMNNNKCPKCGGKLVSRNGKYGEFIGCSNYPKCKFTRK